jgi:hypothetical protein
MKKLVYHRAAPGFESKNNKLFISLLENKVNP